MSNSVPGLGRSAAPQTSTGVAWWVNCWVLMSGLRPEERFSNLERIGRGSFGAVYRCTDVVSRDTVAVKIIDLEQAEDEIDDIQQVRPLASSAALPCGRGCTGAHCPGGAAPRSRVGAPVP